MAIIPYVKIKGKMIIFLITQEKLSAEYNALNS